MTTSSQLRDGSRRKTRLGSKAPELPPSARLR
jgi:hypothetical protein